MDGLLMPRRLDSCGAPLPASTAAAHPLLRGLQVRTVGHFLRADWHCTIRPEGLPDEHVLMLVCAGRGWLEVAGRRLAARRGDLLVAPAATAHGYGADPAEPWTIRYVHALGPECLAWWHLLALPEQGWRLALPSPARADALLLDILVAYRQRTGAVAMALASARLRQLLALALGGGHVPAADPVGRVLAWMADHLAAPADLRLLAQVAGCSPSHCRRLFQAATGMGPVTYFTRQRMQRAAELLAETSMGVAAVAAEMGYADPYHFSRVFRRIIGRPPSLQRPARPRRGR